MKNNPPIPSTMEVDFNFSVAGLKVKFTNLSSDISSRVIFTWSFGDGDESHEIDPKHRYNEIGQYRVTLIARSSSTNEELGSSQQTVLVSDFIKTHLSDSIYTLIDTYIPANIFGRVTTNTKRQFIEKWQLYIQPLVNHEVPIEQYNNELYYEALENQLIMELAAYDFMTNQINLMIQAVSQTIKDNNEVSCCNPGPILPGMGNPPSSNSSGSSSTVTTGNRAVKKITAGPTEVEYFDDTESDTDNASNAIKAMQPGGIIDLIKENICMLASRLEIYLPICTRLSAKRVVPRVVNRRRQGFLDGPDPAEIIH